MSEENKELLRRWFDEVWNRGREEAIDEMFAEGAVANGLVDDAGEPLRGPVNFKPFFRKFREAFPDEAGDRLERDLRQALAQLMARGPVVTVP